MILIRRIFLLLFAMLWCASAWATSVNLAVVKVPVADQSTATLNAAMTTALQAALIKMSGNSNVINAPELKNAFAQAQNDIDRYSYRQKNGNLYLLAHFDVSILRKLLASANVSAWGAERPLTLVWFAEPDAQNHLHIISKDEKSPTIQQLQLLSENRGAPILFPSMDATDQTATGNDIGKTLKDATQIEKISARYNVTSILIGVVDNANPKAININWTWVYNNTPSSFQSTSAAENAAISSGFNQWVDTMAGQLAVTSNTSSSLVLLVQNVNDLSVYGTVTKSLSQLTPVDQVSLAGLSADGLTINLQIHGDVLQLVSALSVVDHLKPVTTDCSPANACPAGVNLVYAWDMPSQS